MATAVASASKVTGKIWDAMFLVFFLGILAAGIWAIVFASANWHRGIYAGYHYNDAQAVVREAMTAKYGKAFTTQLSYAKPPVVNTHLASVLTGTGQVRVFHLIGPQGTKYCVSVWNPGNSTTIKNIVIDGSYVIKKGCTF